MEGALAEQCITERVPPRCAARSTEVEPPMKLNKSVDLLQKRSQLRRQSRYELEIVVSLALKVT